MLRAIHIVAILSVANIAAVGLLWFGSVNMQANKEKEIELRASIAAENQKGEQMSKLEAILASAEKDREDLEKYLFDPTEGNQITLLSEMEQLGLSTTGAIVNTTSLDITSGKAPAVHGEFMISGSWAQLYHLLRLVETYPSHLIVSRITMSKSSSGGATTDTWVGNLVTDIVSLKLK